MPIPVHLNKYVLCCTKERYYSGGRRLDAAQLRDVFSSMLHEGQALQQRYSNQIVENSRQINVNDLLPLVRESV